MESDESDETPMDVDDPTVVQNPEESGESADSGKEVVFEDVAKLQEDEVKFGDVDMSSFLQVSSLPEWAVVELGRYSTLWHTNTYQGGWMAQLVASLLLI